jgi:hypothetical protein
VTPWSRFISLNDKLEQDLDSLHSAYESTRSTLQLYKQLYDETEEEYGTAASKLMEQEFRVTRGRLPLPISDAEMDVSELHKMAQVSSEAQRARLERELQKSQIKGRKNSDDHVLEEAERFLIKSASVSRS